MQSIEWRHFQWSWVTLGDLAKYSMTRCSTRPVCDSWASCCTWHKSNLAVASCAFRVCICDIWKWKRRRQSLRNSLPRNQQQNGERGRLSSIIFCNFALAPFSQIFLLLESDRTYSFSVFHAVAPRTLCFWIGLLKKAWMNNFYRMSAHWRALMI